MKKDQVQGLLFLIPKDKTFVRPNGVEQAEKARIKIQKLQDLKIKLEKIAEVQERLKAVLKKLAEKVETLDS
ncbi:MAG: hypothetical protein HYW47_04495 [Deltaproteobacteria bacterium]|nr:hypothetical protein [Deltaproteobacteria bacterium]